MSFPDLAFYGGSIYNAAAPLIPLPPLLNASPESLSPDPFYSLSDASQTSAYFNEKPYPLVYEQFPPIAAPQDGAFNLESLSPVTDFSFEYFNQSPQNAALPSSSSTGASEVSDPLSMGLLSDDEFLDILRSVSGDMSLSLDGPVTLDLLAPQ